MTKQEQQLVDGFMDSNKSIVMTSYDRDWNALMSVISKLQSVVEEPQDLDSLKDELWMGDVKRTFAEVVEIIEMIKSGEIETV